ncbi:hypothetical protein DH2020_004901 [Rehmannia glutinosa]|uniref:Flavonoid 3'-monooxygenase n=1 Tax=Rehmannia glutinosa TaxID=99300 RepID=A0ABR0XR27_REHGL
MDQFYMTTISVSVLLISIIWYIKSLLKPGGKTPPLPPGPRGLPILGYLPFLGKNLLHQFTDLGHKYGPIYKLYLGNKLYVVISSPSLVKEVVRDHDAVFANRDSPVAALVGTYGANDIAWSPHNSQWRAMRKIFVQEMMNNRNLKESYSLRKDEVRKTIRHVHTKVGMPIGIGELSFQTELNVIRNMLWGGIIEGEEGKRIGAEFRVLISKIVDLFGKPNISDFYPVLAGLDIQGLKKQMENYMQSMDNIFNAVIAQHKQKLSGGVKKEGNKDFVQILLELQGKQDSEVSISDGQIKAILMDVIVGGTDTTATTVEWAMAELMNNPDVMAKAQKELSDVVGLNNIVEELHIPNLKYLEAVIKETLRLHPAIPLLVPRICAGMPLAERMLIYLLSSLLHSFDWKLAEGEIVDMSETFVIVLRKSTPLFALPNPRLHDSNLYLAPRYAAAMQPKKPSFDPLSSDKALQVGSDVIVQKVVELAHSPPRANSTIPGSSNQFVILDEMYSRMVELNENKESMEKGISGVESGMMLEDMV